MVGSNARTRVRIGQTLERNLRYSKLGGERGREGCQSDNSRDRKWSAYHVLTHTHTYTRKSWHTQKNTTRTKIRSRRRPLLYCRSEESSPPTTPSTSILPRRDVLPTIGPIPPRRPPPPRRSGSPFPETPTVPPNLSCFSSFQPQPRYPSFPLVPLFPRLYGSFSRRFSLSRTLATFLFLCVWPKATDRARPTLRTTLLSACRAVAAAKNIPRAFTHTCSRVLQHCRACRCFAVERNDVRSRNAELLPLLFALFTTFCGTWPALLYKIPCSSSALLGDRVIFLHTCERPRNGRLYSTTAVQQGNRALLSPSSSWRLDSARQRTAARSIVYFFTVSLLRASRKTERWDLLPSVHARINERISFAFYASRFRLPSTPRWHARGYVKRNYFPRPML